MKSKDILKNYYSELFVQHGKNEKSLGWTKNKQDIRFGEIMKHVLMKDNGRQLSLLDLGCGFGDLHTYIHKQCEMEVEYWGVDIMPEFIEVAKKNNGDIKEHFILTDFLDWSVSDEATRVPSKWDWIVESGFFGHKLYDTDEECYEYIQKVMKKAFDLCSAGICFDFLSNKVDYRTSENDFHASPEKILELAYGFSRNVMLDNSAMPFEFNITVWKDDSFTKEKTVFNDYKKITQIR